jgi:alpha-tubulin suppressor-like RCC1 family protein
MTLTLTSAGNADADCTATNTLTVRLTDGGSLVAGEDIILDVHSGAAFFPDNAQHSNITVTTGSLGTATARLADCTAETVTVKAILSSDSAITATASTVFGEGDGGDSLVAPTVDEAAGGRIPADAASLTLRVPAWAGMAAGDHLEYFWQATGAEGESVTLHDGFPLIASDVGQDIIFNPDPELAVVPFDGGTAEAWYTVAPADGSAARESAHATWPVGEPVALPAPVVEEADGDSIDLTTLDETFHVNLRWPEMAVNDQVALYWKGTKADGIADPVQVAASHRVTENEMAAGVIRLPLATATWLTAYENGSVAAWYLLNRADGSPSATSDTAAWSVGQAVLLPAPTVTEAVDGEIDPSVSTDSVHVQVTYPGMSSGDSVQVVWQGYLADGTAGEAYRPPLHAVTAGEAAAGVVQVAVETGEQVVPYADGRVVVSYTVVRHGGSTVVASEEAGYTVGAAGGKGLRVMGARYRAGQGGGFPGYSPLVALAEDSRAPVEAEWQYEGAAESYTGTRFADTEPARVLTVRSGNNVVRLRPANLAGTREGYTGSKDNIAACLDSGAVMAWGHDEAASVPEAIAGLRDIISLTSSSPASAFAALRMNGAVVAWGNGLEASVPADIAGRQDFVAVTGCITAFAARSLGGAVVAWGRDEEASVPDNIAGLRDIVAVTGTSDAFVARRADGSVVAWGNEYTVGKLPARIAALQDVRMVVGGYNSAAVLRADGSVMAWGYDDDDEAVSVPNNIAGLHDIVALTCIGSAFAALRQDGSVVAWGKPEFSGSVPDNIAALQDIVALTGNANAFAALRQDGSVVAWGDPEYGGSVSVGIASLHDIVTIAGNAYAFAALRQDGSVVAWGDPEYGGSAPAEIASLRNIRAVYAGMLSFIALTDDGTVHVWGVSGGTPPSGLQGAISYQYPDTRRGESSAE